MPTILILRHLSFPLSITQKTIEQCLASKKISPVRVIAPREVLILSPEDADSDKTKYFNTLQKWSESFRPDDIAVVICEANLGFPGTELLNEATINFLASLITRYSEAVFFLKSGTEQAVTNMEEALKQKGMPIERVIASDPTQAMTKEMTTVIIEQLQQKITPELSERLSQVSL
jgi:hypothetical protein